MLDRCSEAPRQNIPDTEFAELYAFQSALPWAYVWLGKGDRARGSWFQARTLDMDTKDAMARGYGATLWVGHAVFQVLSIPVRGPLKLILKPDVLKDLSPIWPRHFKLDWPAAPDMTLREVVNLGDRIAESGVRMVPR